MQLQKASNHPPMCCIGKTELSALELALLERAANECHALKSSSEAWLDMSGLGELCPRAAEEQKTKTLIIA